MRSTIATSLRAAVLAATALAAAIAPPPAHADGGDAGRKEAERFFRAGERAYGNGQYDTAAMAFEKAYELLPLPAIAFSAAQAHRLQYFKDREPTRLKRAVELYRIYVKAVPTGGRSSDAAASLAELEPMLLRMEASGGTVSMRAAPERTRVMVSALVEGAVGSLDGGEQKPLPLVEDVEPGEHRVQVQAEGYYPFDQKYDVVVGQFRAIEAPLKPRAALVRVRALADSAVAIDGRPVGTAPLARPLELGAGSHYVSVTRRGRQPWSHEVKLSRGEQIDLRAEQPMTGQRKLSYAVLGSAGAAVVAAAVVSIFAGIENRDARELDRQRRDQGITAAELDELEQHTDRRRVLVQSAGSLFGLGVALGAGGALLYFLDQPRAAEAPPVAPIAPQESGGIEPMSGLDLRVEPMIGADGAGLALGGRF